MADNFNKDSGLASGAGATSGGTLGTAGTSPLRDDTSTSGLSSAGSTTGVTTKPALAPVSSSTSNDSDSGNSSGGSQHREEARSHFNAAVEEAKKAVTALKAEAGSRANTYKGQAKDRGQDYSRQVKDYSDQARTKASDLAVEGKGKASDALLSLSRLVDDNASSIDGSLGAKYGDYARTASRSLRETAEKLDQKSVEELTEDAREYVRQNPGVAVGAAALAGFLIARTFSSSRK